MLIALMLLQHLLLLKIYWTSPWMECTEKCMANSKNQLVNINMDKCMSHWKSVYSTNWLKDWKTWIKLVITSAFPSVFIKDKWWKYFQNFLSFSATEVNPGFPNAPFLYLQKISKKKHFFFWLFFHWVQKWNIGLY